MQLEKVNEYSKIFSESKFWEKLKSFSKVAGKKVVEPALLLYYCLLDKETPFKSKMIILSALGYFILPTDAIPDISPLIGFTDDLGALLTAYEMVKVNIKPEHREKADEQLKKWFGED